MDTEKDGRMIARGSWTAVKVAKIAGWRFAIPLTHRAVTYREYMLYGARMF